MAKAAVHEAEASADSGEKAKAVARAKTPFPRRMPIQLMPNGDSFTIFRSS